MEFFDSFSQLGYSAINVVLVFLVAATVLFRSLGLHKRSRLWAIPVLLVAGIGCVFATNYLAEQNRILNDAIRAEGGLKRTLPEN